MKEIEIVYGPDGSVRIEAHGFRGKECLAATEALEKALGLIEAEREAKPEMRQVAARPAAKNSLRTR